MSDEEGISLTDLAGSLVEIRIIDSQNTQKRGQTNLIITGMYGEKEVKFGVIGDKAIASFLSHGRRDKDQIFVNVPEKMLGMTQDNKIQWLNFEY